ncbi:ATP-binding protein [Halobaculum sp. MBLA0143]|uniref:ATP-binding protein n=1 Tax=Halobaculum sp. MBLA0143 TaxID=3079933 RepID=UPI00352482F5
MLSPFVTVVLPSTVGGLLYAVGTLAAFRSDEAGTNSLATATLLVTAGATAAVVVAAPGDTTTMRALVGAATVAATVPWLVFVLQYTGNGELATWPRVTAAATPPVVFAAWTLVSATVGLPTGLSDSPLVAVAASVAVLGTFLLVVSGSALHLYSSLAYDSVESSAGAALWLPVAAPLLAVAFASATPAPASSLAVATLVGGVAVGGGTTLWDVFDTTPAAGRYGRRRLADEITDPVAFLDADGDVIETNDAFDRQFEVQEAAATGDPLPAVIGATLSELVATDSVELITDEGRRQFAPRVSQLHDHRDRVRGTIVVLADITDQKLREQRLAVLNRVVRHNLRNELSVVRGFAQEIGNEGVSNDLAADRIVEASDNLITLGERAREAAQLFDHDPETREVDLGSFVSEIAADLHEEAASLTVETNVPPDARVETDPELLYRSLSHLAQNAVVHNDTDDPRVVVTVTTDCEGAYPVEVTVRDNGPGIPTHEWTAIEEGEETPLEHGSGLGLWAVRWAVTRLGGELQYEQNEPRGSVVRLRLPVADDTQSGTATEPVVGAAVERA